MPDAHIMRFLPAENKQHKACYQSPYRVHRHVAKDAGFFK